LRAKYGWGRVRIARELGISPNTVADWINRFKMPVKTESSMRMVYSCIVS